MAREPGKPVDRPHLAENYRPTVIKKNYVPQTQAPSPSKTVEGNHVPTTSSSPTPTPPPNPKKN
jgi:hypothetical protein